MEWNVYSKKNISEYDSTEYPVSPRGSQSTNNGLFSAIFNGFSV